MKTAQYVRQEKAIAAADLGLAITPCTDCGSPVTIYPPEDGDVGRWTCGKCAGTAIAVSRRRAKTVGPVDPWYVEQERRIQACTADARRLREECKRLFDPGQLYVVEFDSGIVKVGRAGNAEARLAAHAKTGFIRSSWQSLRHPHCSKTERQLIAFCNEHGSLHGGREYFRDVEFEVVRTYADLIVRNALRREYLDELAEAADGDESMTWQEAHERLTGEASPP